MKDFFFSCLKGIAIGSGAILPGISSGVFCVIFGIYEKLLDSVLNFFKDVKTNFIFLFPICLGSIIGILFFSNTLNYCLNKFPIQTKSLFIGLILGCIPALIKEINNKSHFSFSNILFFMTSFFIGIICIFLETKFKNSTFSIENVTYIYLVFCGFLMSIGIIVPGVSSTIILMILGVYNIYLYSVSNIYLPVLIPIGIGIFVGSLICMKITKYFLNKYYSQTFYAIIGFTLGSVFVLFPDINSFIDILISILCLTLRFFYFGKFRKMS